MLPEAAVARAAGRGAAEAIFALAGYERIATPAFEDTDLFERGVGNSTDIVRRRCSPSRTRAGAASPCGPEGTAPICRAYLEHGMQKLAQPVKLFYVGPFFRHERPQAGRYRQFHQIGAEAIGTDSPLADAEVIMLLARPARRRSGCRGCELRLGSLGSLETRARLPRGAEGAPARQPGRALRGGPRADRRQPAARLRLRRRGNAGCDGRARRRCSTASTGEDAEHFAEVRALLEAAGIDYEIDPTLVRGLDYYTRTIFSFVCDRARRPVGDRRRWPLRRPDRAARRPADPGGRLGGGDRADPAGAGRERADSPQRDAFVAVAEEDQRRRARGARRRAAPRRALGRARPAGRSLKGQLKHADRIGARHVVVLEAGGKRAAPRHGDRRTARGRPPRRPRGARRLKHGRAARLATMSQSFPQPAS